MAGPFKMKGSPMHKGTAGHASALKQVASSPMKKTYKEAYATRGEKYQDMDEATYIKEAKRQNVKAYGTTRPTYDLFDTSKPGYNEEKDLKRNSKFVKAFERQEKLDESGVDAKRNKADAKAKAAKPGPTGHKGGDVLTKNTKDTSQKGDEAVKPKVATVAKPTKKERKSARKVKKIAATAKVKTARAKFGRGSDEVKAAKEARRKVRKG